jgi:hypothetical protein
LWRNSSQEGCFKRPLSRATAKNFEPHETGALKRSVDDRASTAACKVIERRDEKSTPPQDCRRSLRFLHMRLEEPKRLVESSGISDENIGRVLIARVVDMVNGRPR